MKKKNFTKALFFLVLSLAFGEKLYAEIKGWFPEEKGTFYMNSEADWENIPPYDCALEDLYWCADTDVVTIRECIYYSEAKTSKTAGKIGNLPAGTKLKLFEPFGYGIKDGVLFPVYSFECTDNNTKIEGYIRGIDIARQWAASSVSDGKGGRYTLYYQKAVNSVNSEKCGKSKQEVENLLFDSRTWYALIFVRNLNKITAAVIIDSEGKKYDVEIESNSRDLFLEYPLNLKNPVMFLREYGADRLQDGRVTGVYCLSVLELKDGKATVRKAFDYSMTGNGEKSYETGYHFFAENGAFVYTYKKDRAGKVTVNERTYYAQSNLFEFKEERTFHGEEEARNFVNFKAGEYYTPCCYLKLRSNPGLSSEKIDSLCPGALLQILEVGKTESIDGVDSCWVKVNVVNDARSYEGGSRSGQNGWVFGGYLR